MTAAPLTLEDGRVVQVDPVDILTRDERVKIFVEWQTRWWQTARDAQIPEKEAERQGIDQNWTECGFLAGRGFGKTRVGAEWLTRSVFLDPSGFDSCVIAPTHRDIKITCFEGESGILSVLPPELLVEHNKSDMFIKMRNVTGGTSTIRGFTAETPERLRGPQHCRAWCDELAAWQYDQDTWDMMMMGMRLGPAPQVLWTTTPKPKELIRKLSASKDRRLLVRGSTYDNKDNLPDTFFANLEQYEGTTLGRQELWGELIDPEENGVIKRSWINLWPSKRKLPKLDWIIMSLDTAYTEKSVDKKGDPDPTACGVWGVFQYKDMSHVILLDCWEDHLGLPDLMKRVKKERNVRYGDDEDQALIRPMFGSSKPMTSGRKPDILLIEDKGSGISLRQMLEREGIEAYAYNPGRADKLTRLHMVSPIFAQKRVWVPESDKFPGKPRNWVEPLIYQLCSFTGERSIKHDDHVDQTTQALRLCMDKRMIDLTRKPRDEWKGDRPAPTVVQNPYAA
jgi:predicted phage terminase large subunit-like protein